MAKRPFPERPAGPDEVVLDIHDIQALTFDLLLQFDAFCKKHNLTYYLCGGTLLGAVRHGGFIPWDDDVDVFMSRPEYDKLLALCAKNDGAFGPDTKFACPENGGFYRPFARIYNLKTHVQRKYNIPISGANVWMDILPVDGLPGDKESLEKLYKTRYYLNRLNFICMWKVGAANRKLNAIKNGIYYIAARPLGVKFWCRVLDKFGRKRPFETSDTVGCLTGGRYGIGEAMPRSAYEVPAYVTFNGREFPTMSCYKEYLTGIYHDYMKLPPVESRKPHLDYVTMTKADYAKVCALHPELKAKN